ncbi:Hypothetical predicted protein [Olea europaea subsp. europaea]|uniref:Uncharacterized protein n=1 Tax=Olea europaea subsp. europaea TaxID=158383 RepID=A0A8S0U623_OLEEU|nr:Hypothetical predicted protein [Olea europaea subsp. europaea]
MGRKGSSNVRRATSSKRLLSIYYRSNTTSSNHRLSICCKSNGLGALEIRFGYCFCVGVGVDGAGGGVAVVVVDGWYCKGHHGDSNDGVVPGNAPSQVAMVLWLWCWWESLGGGDSDGVVFLDLLMAVVFVGGVGGGSGDGNGGFVVENGCSLVVVMVKWRWF